MYESVTDSKFREKLINLLQTSKGEKFNIVAAVYELIESAENKEDAFRFFLENGDDYDSSETEEVKSVFTASEIQKLEKDCSTLIDGILNKLIAKHLDEKTFYSELWNVVMKNDQMFESTNEKIYALYRLCTDGRIPYYELGYGLKMSNEEFKDICEKKKEEIKKSFFILNTSFDQRTERCSLLIEILESCQTKAERSVILAQILAITERKSLSKVLERIKSGGETG